MGASQTAVFQYGDSFDISAEPIALCIGNFDGLHLGHRKIFETTRNLAQGARVVALTFDPHPTKVLAPQHAKPLLYPIEIRTELLLQHVDSVVVKQFTRAFSKLSAESFCKDFLGTFDIKRIVVGKDFCFGADRKGNVAVLTEFGWTLGWETFACAPVAFGGDTVSSSRIRACLKDGAVEEAEQLLGGPFFLVGKVVHGDKVARQLGYPTANIAWQNEVSPRPGIYAGEVQICSDSRRLPAIVSCGFRPTLSSDMKLQIEAHIFNFNQDIYGAECRLFFKKFIRDEIKFSDVSLLKKQIDDDVAVTKNFFHIQ